MKVGGIASSQADVLLTLKVGNLKKKTLQCQAKFYRKMSFSLKIHWGDKNTVCTAFIFWERGYKQVICYKFKVTLVVVL